MKVSVTGIEDAIAKLDKVEDADRLIMEGINEAMHEAAEKVRSAYASQSTNQNFSVDITRIPEGYVLTAQGADVGFLEFGAGWGVMPDEFTDQVDFDVAVGSYSDVEMGQFYKTGHRFWWYVGSEGGRKQYFTHIDATRGMQHALDYLRNNLTPIVRKRIDEWIGN